MSSISGESDVSAGRARSDGAESEDTVREENGGVIEEHGSDQDDRPERRPSLPHISSILRQEKSNVHEEDLAKENGANFHGYSKLKGIDAEKANNTQNLPRRPAARVLQTADDASSIPDDTPSVQGSLLSSPGRSATGSQFSVLRHRPGGLQPFDRRFSSRLSPSPAQSFLGTSRAGSPAFLTPHSRQSSLASQFQLLDSQSEGTETPQPPWEVVRWTKLKKLSGQLFSELGRRNYGRPTCMAVAASIVVGTTRGLIVVFDYSQTLFVTIGLGTKAVECGSITSLAISADHTTIAGGHATGHIFTWEIAKPAKPFLHVVPLDRSQLQNRRSDGHVSGVSVVHIGFLGTRHTALVSADDAGMAFSHLATRGLGAMARVVKTVRVLGRYPQPPSASEPPRKPSSVLAFSPLPLGNVEQSTDSLGLTALLTPYLLVIVSTTPIAETQHKSSRPKELAPHSTLSGCLAWFPAVKLKNSSPNDPKGVSKTKLVYCWSTILTVLDVDATEFPEKDKPPELHFQPRSRWRCDEAIVAVQWLSRSVLAVLTISQRLIILEDGSLRQTDNFDLLQKHIYHQDLFSRQLQPVVESLDEDDASMHGVVADAFHMSFRAYKGRLFLLGFNDISIGTLSNWADRLLALMEEGDFVSAIELATSYYNGDADRLTVGLPEDDSARHEMVHDKLLEMISASLRYTFNKKRLTSGDEQPEEIELKILVAASFTACMSMSELEFLFEDVYDAYEGGSVAHVFFEVIEPYILEQEIQTVPPNVLKDLISQYASHDKGERLEEMICRLDTMTMDLHQTTALCKQYRLYDALIYVWNQAIGDYVTPFIELLSIIRDLDQDVFEEEAEQDAATDSAMKIFAYLAYTFTGRIYPNGDPMSDEVATRAKAELYGYLLAGKTVPWPPGSRNIFLTRQKGESEPAYPYLSLILKFDTSSFMSMLNEAFEDSFLNGSESLANGAVNGTSSTQSQFGTPPTRQTIISILLDVLSPGHFDAEDAIYLDMFIARNLPKFPQFIMLPGTAVRRVLENLCNYPSDEVAEDCQLSVEYLLSFYHPSGLDSLIPAFKDAGFYRVLKSVYRGSKDYPNLLEAYFEDPDSQEAVFECISSCLRPNSGLTAKQRRDVHDVVVKHSRELTRIDTLQTASVLRSYAPDLLRPVLDVVEDELHTQYVFLQALLEPNQTGSVPIQQLPDGIRKPFEERYVQVMCRFNPSHVADYISLLKSGDLRLDQVLPAMESSGVIDAAIVLMARDGLVRDAMDRLTKHLDTVETALTGLIDAATESPDAANTEEAADDLLDAVQKYAKVGIWLCQGQSRASGTRPPVRKGKQKTPQDAEVELSDSERLWLDLLDTVVGISRHVTAASTALESDTITLNIAKITDTLRTTVQTAFTALLTSTTPTQQAPNNVSARTPQHEPFLLIFRAFLTRAARSSPTLSDLRAVLSDIFSAYVFEETVLSLSSQFLDKDLFVHVEEGHTLRQQGWRPKGQNCEGCGKRVWGPGAGTGIWEAWEWRKKFEEKRRRRGRRKEVLEVEVEGRGKGRAVNVVPVEEGRDESDEDDEDEERKEVETKEEDDALVVFACRHLWHRRCLEGTMDAQHSGELRCPLES